MPSHVSPALLATYLVAAANQVLAGDELSSRSRWALANAAYQLQASRDVLAGERQFLAYATDAGMRQLEAEAGTELADIVLKGFAGDSEQAGGLAAREARAVERLDGLVAALKTIADAESSPAALDAARKVSASFSDAEPALSR